MRLIGGLLLLLAASGPVLAQEAVVVLPGVVAVGERQAQALPASLDRVDADDAPARPLVSVSELLQRVPGVAARDRQNLAQDVQLTIRGFGARTTFGVRGLRIYVDGIPATMPDGQGQVSHVPLAAISSVEVLRGPFSALYGNAAGGVIQFFSRDPATRPEGSLEVATGSDSTRRTDVAWSGPWSQAAGAGGYRIDAGRLDSDGFREHSRARRDIAQVRLTGGLATGADVAFTANTMDLEAEDPQGLALAQALHAPRAASAGALSFDTRKRVRQRQAGLRVEQPLDLGRLVIGGHAGTRATWQMLSIPAMAQAGAGSGGGVIDLDRDYGGLDARWVLDQEEGGRPIGFAVGMELQRSSERRLGFENFDGERLGVVGALRRDQRDSVGSDDVYAEARWRFRPRWQATLGVRHSRVGFRSRDRYIAPGNPDDSGALDYAFTTPVAGLSFQPAAWMDLYLNAGRGFETPSASELAYRPDGASGMNIALRPSRTDSHEVGLRVRRAGHALGFAAFDTGTRDELVVASNQGGRSTYANAASTRRRGLELSASGPIARHWHYALAWTALDARYDEAFAVCRAPPCATPDTVVAAGNRIPATAAASGWAELRWTPSAGLTLFLDGNASSRVYADDGNSAWAPGHATFDIGAERRWRFGRAALRGFVRIDNLFDRRTIGSVIVNDGNGRYFEPAPGRGFMLGMRIGFPAPK